MWISRRAFIGRSALAAGGMALGLASRGEGDIGVQGGKPLAVSTWGYGKAANDAALAVLRQGGAALDAVEQGVWVVEADASEPSVGRGGIPNADGVVQLDACIMGPDHRAGSVAALEGFLHPISVARRVMEKTPHVLLVGEGARQFALDQGFETAELLTEGQRRAWEQWKGQQEAQQKRPGHDTLSLLVLDANGDIAGGCSTSGWGYKLPGRVGDSPIIGSGLYVDNEVGAAGATGLGEIIMRYCGSFAVVEKMRQGLSPGEACAETVRRIAQRESGTPHYDVNFVALDKQGRYGAAGSAKYFQYSVGTEQQSGVEKSVYVDG